MLNYEEIKKLRDALIESLRLWQSPNDGFYRSAPIVRADSHPSFTNTGIVLQAFNESGRIHLAQAIADKLIGYLENRQYEPFPHEKGTSESTKAHVVCNSWPVFAILDCYPGRAKVFDKIYDWFLVNQKEGGDWDLLPGEETRYPIFTAYALSALLQLYDCDKKTNTHEPSRLDRVASAIRLGFDFLLQNRAGIAIQEDLLLWPASLNDIGRNPISFSTSAICMHMLAKGSRLLGIPEWEAKVEKTFRSICESFKQDEGDAFTVDGMKVHIWDQIHVNESSLNYFFAFFAPINLTTLLRFSMHPSFRSNKNYYRFISYLTDWMLSHVDYVKGQPGIRPKGFEEVKTWSTAFTVIVLSRILNQAYALAPVFECGKDTQVVKSSEADSEFFKKVDDILRIDSIPEKWKTWVNSSSNALVAILALCIYLLIANHIQSAWNEIEGKTWIIGILLFFVVAWMGLEITNVTRKVKDCMLGFVYKALRRRIWIRQLEEIYRRRPPQ